MNKRILFTSTIFVAVFCMLSVVLAGCGYTARSLIAEKFKTIYISPFVNRVDITQEGYAANKYRLYRPLLETDITRAVINRFLLDGNLRLVEEKSADLVLKGELIEFRKDPLRYDNNDEVAEYRVNVMVNLSVVDKKENKELWHENNFTGDTTFFPIISTSLNVNKVTDDEAISKAITDLARRIVERTVEQW